MTKTQPIKIGFDVSTLILSIEHIVPLKIITPKQRASHKYKIIKNSIDNIGIIEPIVVAKDRHAKNQYLLLDGHMRLDILKASGAKEVLCLQSTDDESFTYNKHINRLSTIQEHKMIQKAVERGVSESKIAQALSVDVASIIRKRNLLAGICEEASNLLKDKMVPSNVFIILKRMHSIRQIEAATLMNDAGMYSLSYAQAILAATPADQLIDPDKPKKIKGLDPEQMARMESEMASLQREYRLIEENYGTDVLNLTLAQGYLRKILCNARIVRYLAQHQPEILNEFQKIAELSSLIKQDTA